MDSVDDQKIIDAGFNLVNSRRLSNNYQTLDRIIGYPLLLASGIATIAFIVVTFILFLLLPPSGIPNEQFITFFKYSIVGFFAVLLLSSSRDYLAKFIFEHDIKATLKEKAIDLAPRELSSFISDLDD